MMWDRENGSLLPANDFVGKSDVEVREAIGDKFPKHIGIRTFSFLHMHQSS
jgi:hypothetical protein